MFEERLNTLTLILVDNKFLDNIYWESVVNEFSSKKNDIKSMFRKK